MNSSIPQAIVTFHRGHVGVTFGVTLRSLGSHSEGILGSHWAYFGDDVGSTLGHSGPFFESP